MEWMLSEQEIMEVVEQSKNKDELLKLIQWSKGQEKKQEYLKTKALEYMKLAEEWYGKSTDEIKKQLVELGKNELTIIFLTNNELREMIYNHYEELAEHHSDKADEIEQEFSKHPLNEEYVHIYLRALSEKMREGS